MSTSPTSPDQEQSRNAGNASKAAIGSSNGGGYAGAFLRKANQKPWLHTGASTPGGLSARSSVSGKTRRTSITNGYGNNQSYAHLESGGFSRPLTEEEKLQREKLIRKENARRRRAKAKLQEHKQIQEEHTRKLALEKRRRDLREYSTYIRGELRKQTPHRPTSPSIDVHAKTPPRQGLVQFDRPPDADAQRHIGSVAQQSVHGALHNIQTDEATDHHAGADTQHVAILPSAVDASSSAVLSMYRTTAQNMNEARGILSGLVDQLATGDLADIVLDSDDESSFELEPATQQARSEPAGDNHGGRDDDDDDDEEEEEGEEDVPAQAQNNCNDNGGGDSRYETDDGRNHIAEEESLGEEYAINRVVNSSLSSSLCSSRYERCHDQQNREEEQGTREHLPVKCELDPFAQIHEQHQEQSAQQGRPLAHSSHIDHSQAESSTEKGPEGDSPKAHTDERRRQHSPSPPPSAMATKDERAFCSFNTMCPQFSANTGPSTRMRRPRWGKGADTEVERERRLLLERRKQFGEKLRKQKRPSKGRRSKNETPACNQHVDSQQQQQQQRRRLQRQQWQKPNATSTRKWRNDGVAHPLDLQTQSEEERRLEESLARIDERLVERIAMFRSNGGTPRPPHQAQQPKQSEQPKQLRKHQQQQQRKEQRTRLRPTLLPMHRDPLMRVNRGRVRVEPGSVDNASANTTPRTPVTDGPKPPTARIAARTAFPFSFSNPAPATLSGHSAVPETQQQQQQQQHPYHQEHYHQQQQQHQQQHQIMTPRWIPQQQQQQQQQQFPENAPPTPRQQSPPPPPPPSHHPRVGFQHESGYQRLPATPGTPGSQLSVPVTELHNNIMLAAPQPPPLSSQPVVSNAFGFSAQLQKPAARPNSLHKFRPSNFRPHPDAPIGFAFPALMHTGEQGSHARPRGPARSCIAPAASVRAAARLSVGQSRHGRDGGEHGPTGWSNDDLMSEDGLIMGLDHSKHRLTSIHNTWSKIERVPLKSPSALGKLPPVSSLPHASHLPDGHRPQRPSRGRRERSGDDARFNRSNGGVVRITEHARGLLDL